MKTIAGLFGMGGAKSDPRADALAESQKRQMAEQDTQRAELDQQGAALSARLGDRRRRGALSFAETGDSGLKAVLGG